MSASPFSYARYRLLFSMAWLLWMGIHVWLLHSYGWTIKAAVTDSVVSNALLLIGSLLIATSLRFYLPRQRRYSYLLALNIIVCLLWFFVSRSLLLVVGSSEDDRIFWSNTVALRLAAGILVLGSSTLLFVLWFILQQQREDEQRNNEMEKLAREAELFHLREQLHPHFLFNSLNSINALIGSQPMEARRMIQQLSDFLRGTLRHHQQQWNTLQQELEHLELYLNIEKVRFGHRLQTVITCSEEAAVVCIPVMLLQPIVENAIKFGLYDTTETITIQIRASLNMQRLTVMVTNPFDPQTLSRKKGTGFGLRSIERRLYLLFAQTGLVQTATSDGQFITTLIIPIPHEKRSNH